MDAFVSIFSAFAFGSSSKQASNCFGLKFRQSEAILKMLLKQVSSTNECGYEKCTNNSFIVLSSSA